MRESGEVFSSKDEILDGKSLLLRMKLAHTIDPNFKTESTRAKITGVKSQNVNKFSI